MVRSRRVLVLSAGLWICWTAVAARVSAQEGRESPPTTYEIQINGESFLVEVNRLVKLESEQNPGQSYEVALRVAPTQHRTLNTFRFDYDLPARLHDDEGRRQRTVRLTHELGFTMQIGRAHV